MKYKKSMVTLFSTIALMGVSQHAHASELKLAEVDADSSESQQLKLADDDSESQQLKLADDDQIDSSKFDLLVESKKNDITLIKDTYNEIIATKKALKENVAIMNQPDVDKNTAVINSVDLLSNQSKLKEKQELLTQLLSNFNQSEQNLSAEQKSLIDSVEDPNQKKEKLDNVINSELKLLGELNEASKLATNNEQHATELLSLFSDDSNNENVVTEPAKKDENKETTKEEKKDESNKDQEKEELLNNIQKDQTQLIQTSNPVVETVQTTQPKSKNNFDTEPLSELVQVSKEIDTQVKELLKQNAEKVNSFKKSKQEISNQLDEEQYQSEIQAENEWLTQELTESSEEVQFEQEEVQTQPASAPVQATQSVGSTVVETAMQYLGTPYVWGGTSPGGFDCSGLVQYVFAQHGISLPRVTTSQEFAGTMISLSEAQPGDLVFFGGRGSTHHVGIYIGNGQYIHAPQPGDVVKITDMQWYMPDFAVRI